MHQDSGKVVLKLLKERQKEQGAPGVIESFRKKDSFDINGTWEEGELQIIVQNPDDENLTATIVVE